jgi:phospholipid transport system substrate-binding protein
MRRSMNKLFIGLNLLALSIFPIQARADAPLDTMKARINQVLAVLRDSSLQGEAGKEAKKKKLRSIFDTTFDYNELSKITLSRNWDKLSADQQKEFQELYRALLDKVYMDTLLSYTDQEVVFGRERTLGENRVEVETKLLGGSKEIPINFRLMSKSGGWWVYDIVIENISLVSNYRSQFSRILSKESVEDMLASLRKQTGKQ